MPDTVSQVPELDDLAGQFRWAAAILVQRDAPLSAALAAGIAGDPELLALAAEARAGVRAVYPLLNAVHFLLLGDPAAPLAAYYDSLTEAPLPRHEAYPAFRAYCLDRRRDVARILRQRPNQITTVGRAATLLPALEHVGRLAAAPLSLIEIGSSAGLNLLVDRHAYDYGAGMRIANAGAPITVSCAVRGMPPRLSGTLPAIGRRIGIDLHPVDPADSEACRWIEASLFPEWREERALLRRGLALRRAVPMEILAGDAMAVLPRLLADLPDPVCVFHSQCVYQWPVAARTALDDLLRAASTGRVIHRIAIENQLDQPLDPAQPRHAEPGFVPASIVHGLYADGRMTARALGQCEQYGHWLEWFA